MCGMIHFWLKRLSLQKQIDYYSPTDLFFKQISEFISFFASLMRLKLIKNKKESYPFAKLVAISDSLLMHLTI